MSCRISSSDEHSCPRRGTAAALRSAGALFLCVIVVTAGELNALPEDAEQPIHILSNAAEVYEDSGLVIYRGDVRLDQGTLKVRADTMTIEIHDEKVVRITAEGNQAQYEQQLRADQSRVMAGAAKIVYHTQNEQIELIGGATLTQDQNEFRGDRIRYDVRAGKIDASAPKDGSVEMTLKPAKNPD